jgi:predicted TPR repeat methyltransferase
MTEAAAASDEFTASWNNVLVDKCERFCSVLLDAPSYRGDVALRSLARTPGASELDVGCGCGDTAIELAKRVGPTGSVPHGRSPRANRSPRSTRPRPA